MKEPSEADLMARVREGDRGAFARVVERYEDRVVGYLTRLTGWPARAEELAQDTFLVLYQNAGRYEEQGKLGAYVYRIATNLVRSENRRQQRRRLLSTLFVASKNGHGPVPSTPEAEAIEDETQQHVAAALAKLPLKFREPLVLHTIEGLPYQAIAEVVGCREGTVKSRISRARAALRHELAPHLNSDGGES